MKYRAVEFGAVAAVAGAGTRAILWTLRRWHVSDEITGSVVVMFIVSAIAFVPFFFHRWFPRGSAASDGDAGKGENGTVPVPDDALAGQKDERRN